MSEEEREIIERIYRKIITSGLREGHKQPRCPVGVQLLGNDLKNAISKCKASLVDFYADWCIPCKILEPIINKLSQVYAGKILFARVNADEHPEVAMEFEVMSLPTVILFRNGEEVYRIIGAVDYNTMRRYIEAFLID
ncbi:thioredoxin [Vulcanisaeta thermophila]|uniref:thioredoxin n=1 Tax=Vulcanisaeta thermophila TaxID=867917 RepID=UPI000A04DB2F|nr:thioredoxin [Vulcanisaeta thermophila]